MAYTPPAPRTPRAHPKAQHQIEPGRRPFQPGRTYRLQVAGVGLALVAALSAQSFVSAREAATYRVAPGDTLSSIARSVGIPVGKLVELNALDNPDLIIAGQGLQLPDDAAATGDGAAGQTAANATTDLQTYTVQSGDTLSAIARSAGVPTSTLLKLNDLTDPDRLKAGQKLKLPAGTPVPQPTGVDGPTAKPGRAQAQRPGPSLQERVATEIYRVGGDQVRVGVVARNLDTGEQVALRADQAFPSASVMKLPILVEVERQVATGKLSWSDAMRAQASAMMVVSDNQAANKMFDLVGPARVNETMASLGLPNTRLFNRFADSRGQLNPGQNKTTPADMARLLEMIATDNLINARSSADLRGFLANNADRSKLVRSLPGDAQVAHKSGWYEGVANDVGIVTVPRTGARWVIAVFAEGLRDAEHGNQVIAAVSRAVYDEWGT